MRTFLIAAILYALVLAGEISNVSVAQDTPALTAMMILGGVAAVLQDIKEIIE